MTARQYGLPVAITVAGTGVHLPDTVVPNAMLAETLDTSDEWIVQRTGIRERRWLDPELATSDMGVAAARSALEAARLTADDVDAIVVSTYTYDQPLPSTALIIKDALGAHRALPLDVTQAACAGGVQAMLIAAHLLQSPAIDTVLVIAADCASRVTDPRDRVTRIFFGDAAAATVVTHAASSERGAGLLSWDFGSQLSYDVEIQAGGSRIPSSAETIAERRHYLRMDGRAVWNTATANLPSSIATAAQRAGLPVQEIDHFFLHQANLNILTETMTQLGVPMDRAPITLDKLGNTGAAGMFTALHQSFTRGHLKPGDTYILSAIGAGFQWGTLCMRHA
ncbi:ketoacyl-ACP synthase III [Pendulispora brunnea]|uniref:Ketoacyl-ACP synthase III n=1 Tax=Pendulispora brunnea TaxID=2905690 RepID=A0ABZ2K874_9BACT